VWFAIDDKEKGWNSGAVLPVTTMLRPFIEPRTKDKAAQTTMGNRLEL
jgi:hypothetical protein